MKSNFFPSSLPEEAIKVTNILTSTIRTAIDGGIYLTVADVDTILNQILSQEELTHTNYQLTIEVLLLHSTCISSEQWDMLLSICNANLEEQSGVHSDIVLASIRPFSQCPRTDLLRFFSSPGSENGLKACLRHANYVVRCAAIKYLHQTLLHAYLVVHDIGIRELPLENQHERTLEGEDIRDRIVDVWKVIAEMCTDSVSQVAGDAFLALQTLLDPAVRQNVSRSSAISNFGFLVQFDPLLSPADGGVWKGLISRVTDALLPKLKHIVLCAQDLLPAEALSVAATWSRLLPSEPSGLQLSDKGGALRRNGRCIARQHAVSAAFSVVAHLLLRALNLRASAGPLRQFRPHPLRPSVLSLDPAGPGGAEKTPAAQLARSALALLLLPAASLQESDPTTALAATEAAALILAQSPDALGGEAGRWTALLAGACLDLWEVTDSESSARARVVQVMALLAVGPETPRPQRLELCECLVVSSGKELREDLEPARKALASRTLVLGWRVMFRSSATDTCQRPRQSPERVQGGDQLNGGHATGTAATGRLGRAGSALVRDVLKSSTRVQGLFSLHATSSAESQMTRSVMTASLISVVLAEAPLVASTPAATTTPTTTQSSDHGKLSDDETAEWVAVALDILEEFSDCLLWPDTPSGSRQSDLVESPHVTTYVTLLSKLCLVMATLKNRNNLPSSFSEPLERMDRLIVELVEWKVAVIQVPLVARMRLMWILSHHVGSFTLTTGAAERQPQALCMCEVIRDSLLRRPSSRESNLKTLETKRFIGMLLFECLGALCRNFPSLIEFVQQLLQQVAKQDWLGTSMKGHGKKLYAQLSAMRVLGSEQLQQTNKANIDDLPLKLLSPSHIGARKGDVQLISLQVTLSVASQWVKHLDCDFDSSMHSVMSALFEPHIMTSFTTSDSRVTGAHGLSHWRHSSPLRAIGANKTLFGSIPRDPLPMYSLDNVFDLPTPNVAYCSKVDISGCDDPLKVTLHAALDTESVALIILLRVQNVSGFCVCDLSLEVATLGPLSLDERCVGKFAPTSASSLKHGSFVERGYVFRLHLGGGSGDEEINEMPVSSRFAPLDFPGEYGSTAKDLLNRGVQVSITLPNQSSGMQATALSTGAADCRVTEEGDLVLDYGAWWVPRGWYLVKAMPSRSWYLTLELFESLRIDCTHEFQVGLSVTSQSREAVLRSFALGCKMYDQTERVAGDDLNTGILRFVFVSKTISGALCSGEVLLLRSRCERFAHQTGNGVNEPTQTWTGRVHLRSNKAGVLQGFQTTLSNLEDWMNHFAGVEHGLLQELQILWYGMEPSIAYNRQVSGDEEPNAMSAVRKVPDPVLQSKHVEGILQSWVHLKKTRNHQ